MTSLAEIDGLSTAELEAELRARRGRPSSGPIVPEPRPAPEEEEFPYLVEFKTAEELEAKVEGETAVLTEREKTVAQRWLAKYRDEILATAKRQIQVEEEEITRQRSGATAGIGPAIGPTIGAYVSYDIMALSPIQLAGGPFRPHKLVPSGHTMLLPALQWVNPRTDVAHGFAVPATTQISGRHMRVRYSHLNLTTGDAGPNFNIDIAALPAPAPSFILFLVAMKAPVVTETQLFELNITSDIVGMAQPYAAFATWHYDVDADLPWLAPAPPNFPPAVPPQLLHNMSMRYMVYPV